MAKLLWESYLVDRASRPLITTMGRIVGEPGPLPPQENPEIRLMIFIRISQFRENPFYL